MAAVRAKRDEVERPIVAQLEAMGWKRIIGKEVGTLDAETPLLVDRWMRPCAESMSGRPAADGLDRNFADLTRDRTDDERRALLRRWPTNATSPHRGR